MLTPHIREELRKDFEETFKVYNGGPNFHREIPNDVMRTWCYTDPVVNTMWMVWVCAYEQYSSQA